ncbi:uncharacterized protein LOC132382212 [Hypanus sabinus]|uniref:uncharacterized protein LOC132382212 n=1 Tax=Hypanus sabinus TaxID=79690 RepID=UPI0028C4E4C1|nr:uncharacterized protein LOC132382212 [Hypanus sabinus]
MDRDKFVCWCQFEDVPVQYACVVSGVDFRVSGDVIVRGLSSVKGIGQVELVARRCGKEVGSSWVLVRTSTEVRTVELPATVSVPGEAGPWGLHFYKDEAEELELEVDPREVPGTSKGRWEEGVVTKPRSPGRVEASELAAALYSLVGVAERPRLKLGVFSGAKPTPDGEVDYETWIEHTSLMLEEWPGSEEEKRQRLLGSLRGLAATTIRELKAEKPGASVEDCLEVLEGAFGLSGEPWLLLAEFQRLEQWRGEKLSEYIFRMEGMLSGLRRRGVVKATDVASVRMSQLFSGSLEEDKVAWTIRQAYRKGPPPSFGPLIREVRTDNNPLTYILTSAKLDATGHRWLAALSVYDFSLRYRPGSKNIDADALSRREPGEEEKDEEWESVPAPGVKAMCQFVITVKAEGRGRLERAVDHLGVFDDAIPLVYCDLTALGTKQLPELSPGEVATAQQNDPGIGTVWRAVEKGDGALAEKAKHPYVPLLLKEWSRLKLKTKILYRVTTPPDQPRCWQLVLPEEYHQTVLQALHDDSGHLGVEKTYGLLKDRFYWPRMRGDVEEYCRGCRRCIQRKTLPALAAPLSHLQSAGPLDLICMDFLSIEPDTSNTANVLVITDHYTRYAQAFPTKDQKATTVAKVLWEKYFVHYGLPRRIHSDQGRDFESRLIQELLTMLGVEKSRTTPYHPQGDPQPERFNRTLLDMLGTLEIGQKSRWSRHIGQLVHCYNCTRNEATGYSPYYLMFGREARLPIDVCFGGGVGEFPGKSHLKYVSDMKRELQRAYELAEAAATKQNQRNKMRYDRKVKFVQLLPGDRVLLRNLGLPGKHKLADRWAASPYVIESQMPNLPVYRVKPEDGKGPIKVLHRNHLLPLGQAVQVDKEPEWEVTPSTRTLRGSGEREEPAAEERGRVPHSGMATDSEEDDSDEWVLFPFASAPVPGEEAPGPSHTELGERREGLEGQMERQTTLVGERVESEREPGRSRVREDPCEEGGAGLSGRPGVSETVGSQVTREPSGAEGVWRSQRIRRPPERLTYVVPGEPSVISTAMGSYVIAFCTWVGFCVLREALGTSSNAMRA